MNAADDDDDARIREYEMHAPKTIDGKLDQLRRMMTNVAADVLEVRQASSPMGLRVRVGIIVVSAFVGGALSNAILWLLGVEPWHLPR